MKKVSKLAAGLVLTVALPIVVASAQGMGPRGGGMTGGHMMGGGMVMDQCKAEIAKLCANVPHGAGGVPACLQKHEADLSKGCKDALANKGPGMRQGTMPQGMGPQGTMPQGMRPGMHQGTMPGQTK